jgi:hypothetical protein
VLSTQTAHAINWNGNKNLECNIMFKRCTSHLNRISQLVTILGTRINHPKSEDRILVHIFMGLFEIHINTSTLNYIRIRCTW